MPSLFWLRYHRNVRPFCVVLIEAESISAAKLSASFEGLGHGGLFAEGHALTADLAALVPADMLGRMLSPQEAEELLKLFELRSFTRKRPPAPSVRRRSPARIREAV